MQAGALQADMQAATEAFWQIMQVQAAVVEDLQKQNEDVARGGPPNVRFTPQSNASAGLAFSQVTPSLPAASCLKLAVCGYLTQPWLPSCESQNPLRSGSQVALVY